MQSKLSTSHPEDSNHAPQLRTSISWPSPSDPDKSTARGRLTSGDLLRLGRRAGPSATDVTGSPGLRARPALARPWPPGDAAGRLRSVPAPAPIAGKQVPCVLGQLRPLPLEALERDPEACLVAAREGAERLAQHLGIDMRGERGDGGIGDELEQDRAVGPQRSVPGGPDLLLPVDLDAFEPEQPGERRCGDVG